MASRRPIDNRKEVGFPTIINAVPYANFQELHGTSRTKNRLRLGLKVTVSMPPQLIAFRYPNLTANGGTPVITYDDQRIVNFRRKAFQSAVRGRLPSRRPKTAPSPTTIRKYQNRFATNFDITEFISSMSWSSQSDKAVGQVELNITLDNAQGLFNYLPAGAKVTVWRRKQLKNTLGADGEDTAGFRAYGKWYPYIVSYIMDKTRTADGRNQTMELQCQDRAGFSLDNNLKGKQVYKKDDKHPHGWSPREITIDICRKNNIPFNSVDIPARWKRGKKATDHSFPRLPKFETSIKTIGAYIYDVWRQSTKLLKRSDEFDYVIHMRKGTLEIEIISPPGYNNVRDGFRVQDQVIMFSDQENIESATLSESMRSLGENPAGRVFTQLYATGTIKERKKKNGKPVSNSKGKPVYRITKIKKKVFNPTNVLVQEAYGLTIRNKTWKKTTFPDHKTFNQKCQRLIDDLSRPGYKLNMKSKGALGIWPGRYVQVTSRYLGVRGFFFVESANYSLSQGQLNVDLKLRVDRRHLAPGKDDQLNSYHKFSKIPRQLKWY